MEKLTYYSDPGSEDDTESCPGYRGSRCLNCNGYHDEHHGWACNRVNRGKDFDDLKYEDRYVTVSMRASRGLQPKGRFAHLYNHVKIEPRKVDMSDWETWAVVKRGHCACNIPSHQCKYHGNATV